MPQTLITPAQAVGIDDAWNKLLKSAGYLAPFGQSLSSILNNVISQGGNNSFPNQVQFEGSNSGAGIVTIGAAGVDTNINISLAPQGNGIVETNAGLAVNGLYGTLTTAGLPVSATVSNIAALRNAPVGAALPVYVEGFANPNDGGGGYFFWDTTVINSQTGWWELNDNKGLVITSNLTSVGRWRRDGFRFTINSSSFPNETANLSKLNVKWFGATGDGVTDDTQAIQNALNIGFQLSEFCFNAVNPSGTSGLIGGIVSVLFPPGTYNVTQTLNVTSCLEVFCDIEGLGRAVIQTNDNTANIIRWSPANATIKNLTFRGGLHHIAMYGITTQLGGFIGPTEDGNVSAMVDQCMFDYPKGPAIWQDLGPISTTTSGFSLPAGTINVNTTGYWPSTGQLIVTSSAGSQTINYTGKGPTSFTGCTGGTGTVLQGAVVSTGLNRTFQNCLRVTNFHFAGAHLYWGLGDSVIFQGGHIEFDQTNPQFSGDGLPLGIFNSGDTLYVTDVTAFGGGSNGPRQAMFVGTGQMFIDDTEWGQNDGLVFIRQRSIANTYSSQNGTPVSLNPGFSAGVFSISNTSLICSFGAMWMEIYEALPDQVSLKNWIVSNDFYDSWGIWIDKGTVSEINIFGTQTGLSIFDMDGFSEFGNIFKVWWGFDQGPNQVNIYSFATEVTEYFTQKKAHSPFIANSAPGNSTFQQNLIQTQAADGWINFSYNLSDSHTNGTPSTDTSTGYSLTIRRAPTNAVSYCEAQFIVPFASLMPNNLPAGIYCFSFYFNPNWTGNMFLYAGPTSGGDGGTSSIQPFYNQGNNQYQRIAFPFFYPGNGENWEVAGTTQFIVPVPVITWTSSTLFRGSGTDGTAGQRVTNGGNVYLCVQSGTSGSAGGPTGTGSGTVDGGCKWDFVKAGGVYTPAAAMGLPMLNAGHDPAPYTFPKNADTNTQFNWIPRIYYGTAAPTTGSYVVGDLFYNTTPVAGGNVGWVCVTAGSPGTWKTFGAISS